MRGFCQCRTRGQHGRRRFRRRQLGILRGAPPSWRGGRRRRRRGRLPWCLRLVVMTPHIVPLPSSSRSSTASCLLTPPLLFASCTHPLLFASCLPAGCCVTPVVMPPPPPPRGFASISSSPSGCRSLQCPTCCSAAASCPLAASALQRAASASQCTAASQLAVSLPLPIHRITIAIVTLVARR